MSGERIVDLFWEMKYPERAERVHEIFRSFSRRFEGIDMEQAQEYRRAERKKWLETFDLSVLDAIGMTVEDLIDARDTKRAQRHQGQKGNDDELLRVIARAFLDVEREGGEFSEAVKRAVDNCSTLTPPHDLKPATARGYLKTLIQWRVTDIEPPRRGRPRKNNP